MALRITDQAYATDTGRQRSANEDSVFVRAPLFVIADGMGGARAGEVASKTVVDAFDRDLPEGPPERVLRETIEGANRTIYSLAHKDPNLAGMGTTTTAAIVDPRSEEVAIGHVGDSRAYRLRTGKLERLTRDHSLVEEMRRKGQLTEAQAEDHPQRSIITRSVGPEPEVDVDLQTVPAQSGDIFLICSDGLTTMLDDDHIERLLDPRHLDAERGPCPGRRSQPGRRPRQHQRDRLQGRRRGRTGARIGGRDADRLERRGRRPDRDRGAPAGGRRRGAAAARGPRREGAGQAPAPASNGWPACSPCWS